MSTPYLIPLTNQNQTLSVSLGGTIYNLRVIWNDANQAWTLDIYDQAGNPVLTGIAVVTGCDLLAQYGYMNFGGKLVAQSDNDPNAVPNYQNLGNTGNLYFVAEG